MTLNNEFKNKSVLITGACGTIGSELTRQICELGAKRVVCVDNNETELFFLENSYRLQSAVECYLVDIRVLDELKQRMQNIDIVFHAAALKHVGLCESSPNAAVRTNVEGVKNVIDAAIYNKVERVIFTSSDKAVNPTNVMGTTKLLGERLMTAASVNYKSSNTVFASTRFGNVLGSRGSVVPLFQKQASQGGPITLTHKSMTRFIMTQEDAVKLVLKTTFMATGGEVFITKMPVVRIEDIAAIIAEGSDETEAIEIKEIGIKPGEKLYEELMNSEEVRRTFEDDEFLIVLPAFCKNVKKDYPHYENSKKATREHNSEVETALSKTDLKKYLINKGIL